MSYAAHVQYFRLNPDARNICEQTKPFFYRHGPTTAKGRCASQLWPAIHAIFLVR
jgi:hypothetical protein